REGAASVHLGRATRLVHLEPRHPGRPRLTLHVDRGTGVPLKVVTERADGSVYQVTAFTSFEPGPQRVEPRRRVGSDPCSWLGSPVPPGEVAERAGFAVLLPAYLPAGFRLTGARILHWRGRSVRLTYTDGVTAFEITERPVLTPAQIGYDLRRRMSEAKARRILRRIESQRIDRLVRSEGGGRAGPVAQRRRGSTHDTYELRIGDISVKVSARRDLDPEEILRVLRSLRGPA
ncbi:MAG: hypothetical protein ACE5JG_05625, partial [Planctomycetota bacterium]